MAAIGLDVILNMMESHAKSTYVITDQFKKPRITVTVMKHGDIFVRGVAIRCKRDRVNVQLGIIKSEGRAAKAIIGKKSTLPINRNEAIRSLFEAGSTPFKFKSEANIVPTGYERTLLGLDNAS